MALNAQQSRIEHSNGASPPTWTEIEEVVNINGPSGTAGSTDTTHLRSTGLESLPQLPDFGEITLDLNLVWGTKQMDLFDMFTSFADPERFRIRYPTSSAATSFHTLEFDASVTAWQATANTNDKQSLSITLKISGGVTYIAPV